MTSLKTSIKTITYLSDIGCLEIQGASLISVLFKCLSMSLLNLNATYGLFDKLCFCILTDMLTPRSRNTSLLLKHAIFFSSEYISIMQLDVYNKVYL